MEFWFIDLSITDEYYPEHETVYVSGHDDDMFNGDYLKINSKYRNRRPLFENSKNELKRTYLYLSSDNSDQTQYWLFND